ncbi:MAG TPA: hypothetical protein DDZ88_23750 [Verrucomicrobiales bacterium]|nr:hypothetical protein [Verrucomicrobiales bacterium]
MKRLLLMPFISLAAFAQTKPDPALEGPKIIAEAFVKLSGALGEAIAKSGPASALSVCSEKAPQIAKEVATAHGVTLRRATHKPRNPKNAADDVEKTALEAFMAALAKKEPPKPQVITSADGSRAFLAPIVLGNPLCLQCHGTPGKDIAPETLAAIEKLYPDDQATGFKLGDLRGLWRVTFPNSK